MTRSQSQARAEVTSYAIRNVSDCLTEFTGKE